MRRIFDAFARGDFHTALQDVRMEVRTHRIADLARDNQAGRTIGVDLAPGMIAGARRRIERAGLEGTEVQSGDACRLELEDASVDALASSYVLDILPPEGILAALREFGRVLRPGGRLVLVNVTPGERRRHRLPELLYGSRLPLTSNCRGIHVAPLLEGLGFAPVDRRYLSQLSLPSEVVCATRGASMS
ncbi:MAG: class I SAM-dependent methyltransferase [Thermoleophilaceae bacterium]